MKAYDINSLFRDSDQNGLFNMFVITFKFDTSVQFKTYTVPEEKEGRIDLICKDIFTGIDDFDLIMNINDIDNPLNIKAGTNLLYPPYTAVSNFRVNTQEVTETRATLLNANKLNRKDSARQKFNEGTQTALPPNFQKEPEPQVKIIGDRLVIG